MDILPFLIVCPLTFLAGFVDAIAGGGVLISLPAYMIAGLPVHTAIATNKLSSSMGTTVATGRLARHGHIHWKQVIPCIFTAVIGSTCGANLALLLDAEMFKRLMLIVIPVTAFYVMRTNLGEKRLDLTEKQRIFRSMLIALGIGVYDGFYGPGIGTFLLLLLTSLAGYKLQEANGTTKAINLITNLTALTVYLVNGKVLLPLGLCAGICSITGNYLGISFFEKKGSTGVKPVMIGVLAIFFIRILFEIIK